MKYHKPHEVRKRKEDVPLNRSLISMELSQLKNRCCEACRMGHVHPPLETSGQNIERPRSALSPNTVKPAQVWTPEIAHTVAEKLSSSKSIRPSTAPSHRRNVPFLSPIDKTPTRKRNSNTSRPKSAFTRVGNKHRYQTGSRNDTQEQKQQQDKRQNTSCYDQEYKNDERNYITPSKQIIPQVHKFQYPDTLERVFSPTLLEAIGPLCRRHLSKDYVCICSCCGEKELAKENEEKAKEAIKLKDLAKIQEEANKAKLQAEKKKKEAEDRRKAKEMKEKLSMLRKKAIYQKCTCFTKSIKRYEQGDRIAKHLPGCPCRKLVKSMPKKKIALTKSILQSRNNLPFDKVKVSSP